MLNGPCRQCLIGQCVEDMTLRSANGNICFSEICSLAAAHLVLLLVTPSHSDDIALANREPVVTDNVF